MARFTLVLVGLTKGAYGGLHWDLGVSCATLVTRAYLCGFATCRACIHAMRHHGVGWSPFDLVKILQALTPSLQICSIKQDVFILPFHTLEMGISKKSLYFLIL